MACELLLQRALRDRNKQVKAVNGPLGQFLAIYLLGARQGRGTWPWSLGALHAAKEGRRGMLRGPHQILTATLVVSKMSKEILFPTRHWVWLFQASLSSTQKRCILLSMCWLLTKEFSCLMFSSPFNIKCGGLPLSRRGRDGAPAKSWGQNLVNAPSYPLQEPAYFLHQLIKWMRKMSLGWYAQVTWHL